MSLDSRIDKRVAQFTLEVLLPILPMTSPSNESPPVQAAAAVAQGEIANEETSIESKPNRSHEEAEKVVTEPDVQDKMPCTEDPKDDEKTELSSCAFSHHPQQQQPARKPLSEDDEDEETGNAAFNRNGDDDGVITAPLCSTAIQPTDDDEERYRKTCRFVARIGWYACYYGATPSRVEVFLQQLMQHFGYHGCLFRVTNSELFCVFCRDTHEDDDQIMRMYELKEGLNLHRLGLLNEVCKQVRTGHLSQAQALETLESIQQEPDPWGVWPVSVSFVVTGALAPAVFQGAWWDLLGGAICSLPVYGLTVGLPPLYQKALPLLSSFAASVVAILLQHWFIPELRVELVVMASVIIQVPGYGASLAVSEIITNHITAGVGRLVNALVTLVMLAGGYWLAVNLLDFVANDDVGDDMHDGEADLETPDPIPVLVQALVCAPCLMVALAIQFQTSLPDFPWSFVNLMLAYGTSYAAEQVSGGKKNIGVLLAAVAVTVFAQAWARWKDRPRSIVITPALVVLVSGSIGFRGLVSLAVEGGPSAAGLKEFSQMFVVALLIIAGLLIGNLLLRAPTTL